MVNIPAKALKVLYGYQKRWLKDSSRFKIWTKSVQIGASFVTALGVLLEMMFHPGSTWLWMSGSQRQSREACEYTRRWVKALAVIGTSIDHDVEEFFGKTKTLVDRVVLPNGSRAFFLPANPDTARGFAGNVVLDEFAIHEGARAIWAAMFGRVSRGYKLWVLSSPKGAIGMFWKLARLCGLDSGIAPAAQPVKAGAWSGHWTDLPMAIADGAPLNYAELREAMGDDDLFAQEYLCAFLDAESQLIPTEAIEAAVGGRATMELSSAWRPEGPLWMGTDVGRHSDRTVHAGLEQIGEDFIVRFVNVQHRATFAAQKARIREYMPLVRRHAIDATGLGMQQAEELHAEFPSKVEPVTFTAEIKGAMALGLRRLFEDHRIEIPDDRDVKADLKAIKRIATEAGNFRYDAKRTEKAGHADRFWPLGLAWHASERKGISLAECVIASRAAAGADAFDGDDDPIGDRYWNSDEDPGDLRGRSVYARML